MDPTLQEISFSFQENEKKDQKTKVKRMSGKKTFPLVHKKLMIENDFRAK